MPGTDPREDLVLVLAPTGRDARLIADELGRHGFSALTCPTLDRLCAEIDAGAGTAVLAEEALPPAGLASLVEALNRQPPWSDLPLLVLTGKGTPSAGSLRRFEVLEPVANVTQLERPVQTRTLTSAVRSALRARRRQYDVRGHLAEQERQSAALRDREARLQLAVDIAHMGVFEIDLVTDAVEVNEPGRDIYGWADTRTTFASVKSHFHPDDKERVLRQVERAFDPDGPGTFETEQRIVRTDGAVRWIRVRGRTAFETRGAERRAVRCVGTYLDVTERKAADEALRASEERVRTALTAARMVAWEWTPADGKLRVSENAADVFGLPAGVGLTGIDQGLALLHPEDLAAYRAAFQRAIDDRTGYLTRHRLIRPDDGRVVWIEERGNTVFDRPGGGVRLYGVAMDVTDRKRAEEELQASEERYRTLFTSMDEGYCVIEVIFDPADPGRAVDYRFLEVNPAFEAQAGMRDVVGRRMLEFVPSIEGHWLTNYGRVALTGEPIRFANEYKTLYRWFDVYAFRVGPPDGRRVAVLFTDITARRRAEEERERLVEQLRDADRRKDEFLALLAHELRNPLAPLRNGLQVMRLAPTDAAAVTRSQAMMDRQLSHMVRLIDDLLDVSRISRSKMELRRTRLLLSDVVSSAVETVRPALDAARHELTVSLPDEPLHLDADLTRLAQVVGNLLGNSAKYTPPGGRIRLTAAADGDHAVVTVSDNGIGIPAESLPTIFDMFSQVDRSIERQTGGLGIGLALVRGLVEMHGGTVAAASDGPGKGSTFTVRLPLVRPSPAPAAPERNGVASAVGSGRRVLVVDDNVDAAESMAEMLKLLGYRVAVAHDGVQAVEAAERVRPDVVLMDVGMPKMNGLDAARRIREQPWGRDAVIVALTGWGQNGDRAKSKEAGCDGHLVKPVSLPDLQSLLRELV